MAGTRRERQLARERYERQQARRMAARARARRRQQVIGAVVGVLAVIGGVFLLTRLVGGDDPATPAAQTSPSAQPSPSASAGACDPAPPRPKQPQQFPKEPALTVERTTYTATVKTNCGDLVLQLDAAKAPRTVNSFVFLASKNYFDNAPCHRLSMVNPFVVQCGDPSGTGSGGPGYKFADENLPKTGANNYPAGTLAMANAGKGTNGSQFFLVYRDTTLGPDYTVFGKLVAGQDVLDKIRAGGVAGGREDGNPMTKVSILDVTTTKGTP